MSVLKVISFIVWLSMLTPCMTQTTTVQSWFDPQVEFLEVGVAVNGVKSWKGLGLDVCGTYGGCMGIGGLESVVPETGAATGIITDYFGNSVASVQGGVTTWNITKVGGFGPLPNNTAKPLSSSINLATAAVWRGKAIDPTGFYYWGARPYDPQSGRFLSPDPAGHSSSMTLYDYVGNDPINRLDADGRIATNYGTKAIGFFDQGSGPNANAYFQHTYNTQLQNQASTLYWSQFSGTERGLRQNVPGVQNGMMAVDALAQGNYQRAGQYSLAAGLDVGLAAATMRAMAPPAQASARIAPEFTFRGDARPPSTIFNEGLSARGSSSDLFAHALDNMRPPSAFISTSQSADIAAGFSNNIFVVRPRNGIDVNQVLGSRSPFPNELEIAIPRRINPTDIRGVMLPNEGVSLLNPNWLP